MAISESESLLDLILNDPELLAELQDCADREIFATRAAQIANANGIGLRKETILETMNQNRSRWAERWI